MSDIHAAYAISYVTARKPVAERLAPLGEAAGPTSALPEDSVHLSAAALTVLKRQSVFYEAPLGALPVDDLLSAVTDQSDEPSEGLLAEVLGDRQETELF